MLENFNSFKKKITFYSIIYWIISWGIVSIIINVIGNLLFDIEYGSSDSAITDFFALVSIGLSLYLATKFTKKFRRKKYSSWLAENLDEKDPDLKAIMVKLMNMNVIDPSIVSNSELEPESKSFITDFNYDTNNRVEALKEKYKIKIDENGLYILPYSYTLLYMLIAIFGTIFLGVFISQKIFSIIGFNEEQSGFFFIPLILVLGLLAYLFYKFSSNYTNFLKRKVIININKDGIKFNNRFFDWKYIELPQSFISDFENINLRSNVLDLSFIYKNETVRMNFRTNKTYVIYYYILYFKYV